MSKNVHSTPLSLSLKSLIDAESRTEIGSEFHNFGAEDVNDLSKKEVRDLGTNNVPVVHDLRLRL